MQNNIILLEKTTGKKVILIKEDEPVLSARRLGAKQALIKKGFDDLSESQYAVLYIINKFGRSSLPKPYNSLGRGQIAREAGIKGSTFALNGQKMKAYLNGDLEAGDGWPKGTEFIEKVKGMSAAQLSNLALQAFVNNQNKAEVNKTNDQIGNKRSLKLLTPDERARVDAKRAEMGKEPINWEKVMMGESKKKKRHNYSGIGFINGVRMGDCGDCGAKQVNISSHDCDESEGAPEADSAPAALSEGSIKNPNISNSGLTNYLAVAKAGQRNGHVKNIMDGTAYKGEDPYFTIEKNDGTYDMVELDRGNGAIAVFYDIEGAIGGKDHDIMSIDEFKRYVSKLPKQTAAPIMEDVDLHQSDEYPTLDNYLKIAIAGYHNGHITNLDDSSNYNDGQHFSMTKLNGEIDVVEMDPTSDTGNALLHKDVKGNNFEHDSTWVDQTKFKQYVASLPKGPSLKERTPWMNGQKNIEENTKDERKVEGKRNHNV